MSNNIIDSPSDLINLSKDELEEVLIDKYRNSALLRELLRRTLYELKLERDFRKETEKRLEEIENNITKVIKEYRGEY